MIESEAYSELCQTSSVESFAKIVNNFKKITIFKMKWCDMNLMLYNSII